MVKIKYTTRDKCMLLKLLAVYDKPFAAVLE